jgi:hypothetical protein
VNTAGEVFRFLTLWGPPPASITVGVEFRWAPGWLFGLRAPGQRVFVAAPLDPAELFDPMPRDAANAPVWLGSVDP